MRNGVFGISVYRRLAILPRAHVFYFLNEIKTIRSCFFYQTDLILRPHPKRQHRFHSEYIIFLSFFLPHALVFVFAKFYQKYLKKHLPYFMTFFWSVS